MLQVCHLSLHPLEEATKTQVLRLERLSLKN